MSAVRIYRLRQQGARAIVRAMITFLKRILAAWTAARSRTELSALSDRMLNDIGLRRGEIERLFR